MQSTPGPRANCLGRARATGWQTWRRSLQHAARLAIIAVGHSSGRENFRQSALGQLRGMTSAWKKKAPPASLVM